MPVLSVNKITFNFPFISAAASPAIAQVSNPPGEMQEGAAGAGTAAIPGPFLFSAGEEGDCLGPLGRTEGVLHTTAESCCFPP